MIRALIIEDDAFQRAELREFLSSEVVDVDFTEAEALDQALVCLTNHEFDVIFCDMRIPSEPGAADHSKFFGGQAYREAVSSQPGAIRVFWSAFLDLETIGGDLAASVPSDLYGDGVRRDLTRQVVKGTGSFDSCLATLQEVAEGLRALEGIELRWQGNDPLDWAEERALRHFGRSQGAASVHARPLGGLSDARPMEIVLRDASGRQIAQAFGKIGPRGLLEEELRGYTNHVANRLRFGAFAPNTATIRSLMGRKIGIFFSYAEEFNRTLMGMLGGMDAEVAAVARSLPQIWSRWPTDEAAYTVRDVRMERISDTRLLPFLEANELLGVWREVEAVELVGPVGIQHGDLHGKNILVDAEGRALLIDFADVSPMPAGLDPMTLELCCYAHPDSPLLDSEWPTPWHLERWFDREAYLEGCPVPQFVVVCRDWLEDVCPSRQCAGALLWAHSARQYKYGLMSNDCLSALMRAAATAVLQG